MTRTETKQAAAVLEIKAADTRSGEFTGYGSTFGGEPDAYGDVIAKGAFAESIGVHRDRGTMPKMFWQHDPDRPIGRWLAAEEDDHGLLMTGRLNMDVQQGREAHALLKAGDIDGLSIGYRVKRWSKDEEADIYTLEELDLIEVSVVSMPANESATVGSVKSARQAAELRQKLAAGDRLTIREFETLLKGTLGFSNSEAERAARIHLKDQQGDPADDAVSRAADLFRALTAA